MEQLQQADTREGWGGRGVFTAELPLHPVLRPQTKVFQSQDLQLSPFQKWLLVEALQESEGVQVQLRDLCL